DEATLRKQMDRLGETPFALRAVSMSVDGPALVPPSALNRARRALVAALLEASGRPLKRDPRSASDLLAEARPPEAPPPPPGLFVLCRNEAQARAALGA